MINPFNKIADLWHYLSANYFVIANTNNSHKYLKYDAEKGTQDFVDSPNDATCFDLTLGTVVMNALNKNFPKLSFSLQEMANAKFVDYVQNSNFTGKEQQQYRITKIGLVYLDKNKKSSGEDIMFLSKLQDHKWHSSKELKGIPDIEEIIKVALSHKLIECQ